MGSFRWVSALFLACQFLFFTAAAAQADPVGDFLGRWDVTLHTPGRDYGSWLEITDTGGQLAGRIVTRWGHAHAVINLQIKDGVLSFASPARQEGMREDMPFRARLVNGELSGEATGPNHAAWTWTGRRAPALSRAATPRWGSPIRLFDGTDTNGWVFNQPEDSGNWSVKDGILTRNRDGSDLVTARKFKDFKLHLEFNCATGCNSGVYLRGRYEVQITDATGKVPPNRRAAAVYGYLAPSPAAIVIPGHWETYDITLVGRTVTVAYNGHVVIDHQPIPGVTGGALDSREGQPGPIYLQGSEKAGATSFRNIVITPANE